MPSLPAATPGGAARRPLLGSRRDRAERYLFLAVAGFAISVAATRWFLDMTGYPKVGGGGLHIAHMLWGGLLLVIAATLPLLFVGRRVLVLASIASGVGVGLFIDEIGKFVTETNDYFFAPAAPLIYGALLLLTALWAVVWHRRDVIASAHNVLQDGVEAARAAIDGDLTRQERDRVAADLETIVASGDPASATIARRQLDLLRTPELEARLAQPGLIESGRMAAIRDRLLPLRLERAIILVGLLWSAFQAALTVLLLAILLGVGIPDVVSVPEGPVEFPTEPLWSVLALAISAGVGIAGGIAAVLLLRRRERAGLRIAITATLVNLVAGGLLTFYVAQFGAMASAVGQLVLLALLFDYQGRRAASAPPEPAP
jgi:hypothetical protein